MVSKYASTHIFRHPDHLRMCLLWSHPSHICSLPYLQMLPISLSEESQTHIQTASRHIWHLGIGGIPTASQGSETYLFIS